MDRVMTAQKANNMREWLERHHRLEGDDLVRAMNALRRDVWEGDAEFSRTNAVLYPMAIEPGLFGVSH